MNVLCRTLLGWSFGLMAGALAFSVGWGGDAPGAFLLLPFVVIVILLAAGPGVLVESLLLALGTGALARRGFRRPAIILMAMAAGILLGLLNIFPAERLLHSLTGDNSVVKLADIPRAYLLGGCYGGAACGFGAAITVEPGARS